MSERASEAIKRAIRRSGPITFAEFMEHALYGPGGYYERPPVGAEGDFVTSPHVHPVFGSLLAAAVADLFAGLGEPEPLKIAEIGAGDGTLAMQVLGALGERRVEYEVIDISPGARSALASIEGVRIGTDLGEPPDVVLANELLDNLPFRRIRGDREIRIDFDGNRLVEVEVAWGGRPSPPDHETTVPVGAFAFVDRLASTLTRAYALLIDYGSMGSGGGDTHGYRDHRVIEDVLAEPGTTDITAGVDFALVAERAERAGLEALPVVTQRDALLALGFERWLQQELARQTSQLDARDGRGAVRTWSGRSRATSLIEPSALGRLRWLVLRTPGLPTPAFLAAR